MSLSAERSVVEGAYLAEFTTEAPPIGWTGDRSQCQPGATSEEFEAATLRRVNFFRSLAGVPADVTTDDLLDERAQAAALVIAQKGQLTHALPADWPCYSTSAAKGAAHGNIHLGFVGPQAISAFIDDRGANNSLVGHRRWLLFPPTHHVGLGNVPSADGRPASSTVVFASSETSERVRPPTRTSFVAWPSPGYFPAPLVSERWSFSLPSADFRGATVGVTRNGIPVAVNIEHEARRGEGYGDDTIVWTLPGSGPLTAGSSDDVFGVTIGVGGASHHYEVAVFSPAPGGVGAAVDATVSLPTPSRNSVTSIGPSAANTPSAIGQEGRGQEGRGQEGRGQEGRGATNAGSKTAVVVAAGRHRRPVTARNRANPNAHKVQPIRRITKKRAKSRPPRRRVVT